MTLFFHNAMNIEGLRAEALSFNHHFNAIRSLPLSLLLTLTACEIGAPARVEAPADSAAGVVEFDLAGPGGAALVVPVHLNGQGPFTFVLDTGATLTCVAHATADSLALPEVRGGIGFGAGIGGAGSVELVSIDSMRVGQAQAFAMNACAVDLSQLEQAGIHIDGLVGLNFLKNFRVTLDFAAETLQLSTY